MGFVNDVLNLVGLGRSPKASGAEASGDVEADKAKAKSTRAKLLETAGGVQGEELLSGTTKKRESLLGN